MFRQMLIARGVKREKTGMKCRDLIIIKCSVQLKKKSKPLQMSRCIYPRFSEVLVGSMYAHRVTDHLPLTPRALAEAMQSFP